jgi:hypothetical protein
VTSSAASVSRVADMRAKRGARWLDENFARWEDKVEPTTLRLRSGTDCICGQVFADNPQYRSGYGYAEDTFFADANHWVSTIVAPGEEGRAQRVGIALGFLEGAVNSPEHGRMRHILRFKSDRIKVSFNDLQTAWLKLLANRFEATVNVA